MATSCTSLLFVSFLAFLFASVAVDASVVNETCAKTKQPDYCVTLLKDIKETNATDQRLLAQFLMGKASKLAYEVTRLVRLEQSKLPKDSTQRHCMERCGDSFKAVGSRLAKVNYTVNTKMNDAKYQGAILYLSIRKSDMDQSWRYNCNECQGQDATGDLASTHDNFDKVIDMVNVISHCKKQSIIDKFRAAIKA